MTVPTVMSRELVDRELRREFGRFSLAGSAAVLAERLGPPAAAPSADLASDLLEAAVAAKRDELRGPEVARRRVVVRS